LCLSDLMTSFPAIRQVDINPLKLLEDGKGCYAVDVRVEIESTPLS
ncbi:MAG: acetate--CoA ligase family protein, partial [Deltaproteobacteria bacterium]|nr:acetate--CoA ligase family protein [Deltaproteobacteria bacterium]